MGRWFRPPSGSSFPSLFALKYAATFGFLAVPATMTGSGVLRGALRTVGGAFLILGWVARIALAAPRASKVIISYYLGLFWPVFLICLVLM